MESAEDQWLNTSNLVEWIQEAAGSEPIEAVVIGAKGWDPPPAEPGGGFGVVLTWAEAVPALNYQFSAGRGSPGCHAIWAWTPTKVLFVSQSDGATRLESVPRHPQAGWPDMPGC